jgi:hypothetical protein
MLNSGGADQSSCSRRISMTGASSDHRVKAVAGSSPGARGGAPVRAGSSSCQMACRVLWKPVARPSRRGELAKAATRVGPIACSSSHRRCRSTAGVAASTLTCTDAVEHIIAGPVAPQGRKYRSMAR